MVHAAATTTQVCQSDPSLETRVFIYPLRSPRSPLLVDDCPSHLLLCDFLRGSGRRRCRERRAGVTNIDRCLGQGC